MANVAQVNFCDSQNGPGLRVSVFLSGCSLRCKGCHNQEAQDPNYGKPFDLVTYLGIEEALKNPDIDGISLLGGDPMEAYNQPLTWKLCALAKEHGKTVWLWTGRKLEQFQGEHNTLPQLILKLTDVVVDGPFVQKLHDPNLEYCGSSNQRVIYLKGM